MMRRGIDTRAALLTVGLAILVPAVGWGADPIGSFSISGELGLGGYSMGAVNDGINRSNDHLALLQPEWDVPDELQVGFDFLADASYDLSYSLRVGLSYLSSSGSTSVDYLQYIEVEPSATMIIPRLYYRLPWRPTIDMSLRGFGGPVFLRNVETKITHENTSEGEPRLESMTIEASGTGFEGGVMGEYTLSDRFTLTFEGGYRSAKTTYDSGAWKIENIQDPQSINNETGLPNSRSLQRQSYLWGFLNEDYETVVQTTTEPTVREDLDADFSGVIAKVGLRVYIF
ncbi:MAG: hypothetical protein GF346_10990 [Candidatus Eisenbacteria bacterium]|nr:hypothetical protein [Candidatus Latescibacterota bacterium]MBD3302963.1 hypothetical protein [Candidatus Eisenbacteria bacterium]